MNIITVSPSQKEKETYLVRGAGKRAVIVELDKNSIATLSHPKSLEFQACLDDNYTLIEKVVIYATLIARQRGWKFISTVMIINEDFVQTCDGRLIFTNRSVGSGWLFSGHTVYKILTQFNRVVY